jgi:flagellar motility protein MotE (MotC chaperone)
MKPSAGANLIISVAGAIMLSPILFTPTHANEPGWTTVVEKKSEAMARQMKSMPTAPLPNKIKPATTAKAAPAQQKSAVKPGRPEVLIPVDESEITTGAVNAPKPPAALAPSDTARLFSDDAAANAPSDLTTGTVDGQGSDLSRGYCVSIAAAAADARTALQMTKLTEMEKQIGRRIALLEAKTAEYKTWMERRDAFLKRATGSLVKIYSQMEPDAASAQLVAMDEETAASLLMKLEPGNASAILNEMAPDKAARLAAGLVGAARLPATGGFPQPTQRAAAPAAPPLPPRPGQDSPDRVYPEGKL